MARTSANQSAPAIDVNQGETFSDWRELIGSLMCAPWVIASHQKSIRLFLFVTAKRCPSMPTAQFVDPHPPKPYIELFIDFKCTPGYLMPNYTLRYMEWQAKKPRMYEASRTEV
jgi:hypothetical protein